VPGSSPLFQQGGNPPSRQHAFLHTRFGGDVKQIVIVDKGGKAQKRIRAKAVLRNSASAVSHKSGKAAIR
jgi:hypothetical protein